VKKSLPSAALSTAAFLATLLCQTIPARAQESHAHQHGPAEQLGRVNFEVSCTPAARKQFNRAVAWLHSFEYEEAEKAFAQVAATDPRCGMAHWGVAMSNYHPLWAPPTAAELEKGRQAVERAKSVGARTQRERDYIAAIELFYKDADRLDHRARANAYGEALGQLSKRYPSDREAEVFYALALIAKGLGSGDKSYASEKEAARILNRVLAQEPEHPGVTHYLIHGYDYPALAHMAVPAARSYAKIAPSSAHARHMPSHIFTRLGMWQDSIQSNLSSKAAAEAFAVRNRMRDAWDEKLHAMDYLAYAYLQGAEDARARGVLEELNRIRKVEPESFKVAYAASAIPARYALERRRWDEAARLTLREGLLGDFPWKSFGWAEAHIHFARAVGAARNGDAAAARLEVERLTETGRALAEVKGGYDWARQVEIARQVAAAWAAHAEGRREESLRLMRAAAELDDSTEKHPVTPGAILPAREQLGELLLELKQPADALREFEASLQNAPKRFNGLYGAARAAALAGDRPKAEGYYRQLLAQSQRADAERPELREAKEFLAGGGTRSSQIRDNRR
jgi:tetratricopeptide (TPR) repeat protein